ncbi:MAG: hypothetical protein M3Q06_09820 [Bacteroidota bacterium]|nr:hypothetical protein [Bacteroidota bacterium]
MKTILPYHYLLGAALLFAIVVVVILLFILFFLQRYHTRQLRKVQLRSLFSDLVAGVAICESEEERQETLQQFLLDQKPRMKKHFTRKILIREIVKTKDSVSGIAAENLQWLYETLELDKDSLRRFRSKLWFRKASAIQHLAEMQQSKHLVKIYRETNHANNYIRTEAQIAVVKLTGFKGLRFLSIVTYPITQWQQLSLINQLEQTDADAEQIRPWLSSKNDTVVEFALRLVAIYKCHELYNEAVACLEHSSVLVRLQAIQVSKEIYEESTLPALLHHFGSATKEEQMAILNLLPEIGAGTGEISFLTSLLHYKEEGIRYKAMQLIQQISPSWSSQVMLQVKDNPSFTSILPLLQKQAV